MKVRPAETDDAAQISGLVSDVVRELYGHLFDGEPPFPADPDPPVGGWVAVADGSVVGVGAGDGDYIDDLWLRPGYRGRKIGSALLSTLESQIRKGGHSRARLRVVAENHRARGFFARRGWRETRIYPHERWGFPMVDMHKDLGPGP